MITFFKLTSNIRKKKRTRLWKLPPLGGSPQRQGICTKIYTTSPKKPNSAVRKVVKVRLSTGKSVIVGIPGIGFKIMQFSVVMVRGGRVPDVPGVRYKLIRGVYDFTDSELYGRRKRRSKFGQTKEVNIIQYELAAARRHLRVPYKKKNK